MRMIGRIGQWFQENKERLALFFGIVLVGALCFEAGLLQGRTRAGAPLILSIPPLTEESATDEASSAPPVVLAPSLEPVVAKSGNEILCAFVGSKNSTKYHLPSCAVAKRIKPENRVCFASKEEAEKRGYQPSCIQ